MPAVMPKIPSGVDPIMRMPAVLATVCMSRSWLLASIKEGTFPAPVKLGAKAVGWRASAVTEWLRTREELGDASLAS
jgi:prophage regulatory protein